MKITARKLTVATIIFFILSGMMFDSMLCYTVALLFLVVSPVTSTKN